MNLPHTLLAIILANIIVNINAHEEWDFGEDSKKNVIIIQKSGQITERVTKVSLLRGISCMDLVFLRVKVYNSISSPKVTYDSYTNTVHIVQKRLLTRNSESTYEIVGKGKAVPNCEKENSEKEYNKWNCKKKLNKKRKHKKCNANSDEHEFGLGNNKINDNYEIGHEDYKLNEFADGMVKDSGKNKSKGSDDGIGKNFDGHLAKVSDKYNSMVSTEDKTKSNDEVKIADTKNSNDSIVDLGKKDKDKKELPKLRNHHKFYRKFKNYKL